MDLYAVIGNPVEHSQSPFIHEQFARQTGQVMRYERRFSPLAEFASTVRSFVEAGARGCNVTVPFKREAWALGAHRTARSELAGTANTLRFDSDGWQADNTDGVGLVCDITRNAGVTVNGARLLLVGAGGAAAGVLGPLVEQRPAELVVVNRTAERAAGLIEVHGAVARRHGVRLTMAPIENCGVAFDVVINATSSSLHGRPVAVAADVLRAGGLALDMMYGPAAREFLAWAARHGARGRDGLGMLVEQAAEAFYFWRGVRPDSQPVLRALRERLDEVGA
jgi:shikimate dehydrogenase